MIGSGKPSPKPVEDSAEAEINRRVKQKLQEPMPADLHEIRLHDVIEYIRTYTGLNVHADWNALQNVGIDQDYPITLQVRNVPVAQVLELVLADVSSAHELNPVSYIVHKGIVKISTDRKLKTSIRTTAVYDIRDLLTSVTVSYRTAPPLGVVDGRDSTLDEEQDVRTPSLTRAEAVVRIIGLIRQIGRPHEWREYGGDVSSVSVLDGHLIVRTTPQNHLEVQKLLTMFRMTHSLQLHVESRWLIVEDGFLEEVGNDLNMQTGADDPDDKWPPFKFAQDTFSVASRQSTGITGSVGGSGRLLNMGFSYLDDAQVAVLIKAAKSSHNAAMLTAPRLTIFNGRRAYISIPREVAYVRGYEPSPDGNGLDPQLGTARSGVTFEVMGAVSADRTYVTLTLNSEIATLVNMKKVPFEGGPAGAFIDVPEVVTWKLNTTVSIPDRQALLLVGDKVNNVRLPDGKTFDGPRRVLLLVKPTIIIQTGIEEPDVPAPAYRR